jgi:hypothetical protein
MAKLIHVRHGGIVAVAPRPAVEGEHPTTALHVQGTELANDLADAEVRLAPDEVAKLVSELVQVLPADHRQQLVARLCAT